MDPADYTPTDFVDTAFGPVPIADIEAFEDLIGVDLAETVIHYSEREIEQARQEFITAFQFEEDEFAIVGHFFVPHNPIDAAFGFDGEEVLCKCIVKDGEQEPQFMCPKCGVYRENEGFAWRPILGVTFDDEPDFQTLLDAEPITPASDSRYPLVLHPEEDVFEKADELFCGYTVEQWNKLTDKQKDVALDGLEGDPWEKQQAELRVQKEREAHEKRAKAFLCTCVPHAGVSNVETWRKQLKVHQAKCELKINNPPGTTPPTSNTVSKPTTTAPKVCNCKTTTKDGKNCLIHTSWCNLMKPTPNQWSGGGTYTAKDRHYNQKFDLMGDGTVFINLSSMKNDRKDDDVIPDFGLYFDWGWHPWWRNEHIAWPDRGIPTNMEIALEQIIEALERAQKGEVVEMGCIGAHGRTGTAMAVQMVVLGMEPKAAIDRVHEAYCEHAIESDVQEWWIEWADAVLHDKPIPEKPVVKSYTTKGVVSSGNKCSVAEHWDLWIEGWVECKFEDCTFWKGDTGRFENKNNPFTPPGKDVKRERSLVEKRRPPKAPSQKTTTSTGPSGATSWVDTYVASGYGIPDGQQFKIPVPRPGDVRHGPQCIAKVKKGKNPKAKCDVCRYLDAGFEAFLKPSNLEKGKAWEEEMDSVLPKPKKEDDQQWMIDPKDSSIFAITVSESFYDQHPLPALGAKPGVRLNGYLFVQDYGWCYDMHAPSTKEEVTSQPPTTSTATNPSSEPRLSRKAMRKQRRKERQETRQREQQQSKQRRNRKGRRDNPGYL